MVPRYSQWLRNKSKACYHVYDVTVLVSSTEYMTEVTPVMFGFDNMQSTDSLK